MQVSVIILGYNRADMLSKCVKTLQSQDFKDMEIILADNASTDNSVSIARSLGLTKILEMKENRGFGFTNNEGAKIADGEFIFFVNNDMYFEKNC